MTPAFWRGRRVLVTGHTGFKGAWLALALAGLGARVTGFSDAVAGGPSLHAAAGVAGEVDERWGDVRDAERVAAVVAEARPEVVLHLAAQALVLPGYADPVGTFATNAMGTAHVLDAVRRHPGGVGAVVCVTSDKCYAEDGTGRPYREGDPLGGADPYSASKGAAELVAGAYRRSYFAAADGPRIATARAGNVIGGGDWGARRLVPDVIRAAREGRPVVLRHPAATRPWQHVLDALAGYLRLAERLCEDPAAADAWNFGPPPGEVRTVRWVVERVAARWPGPVEVEIDAATQLHEAPALTLDASAAAERLGWVPRWGVEEALAATVDWYAADAARADVAALTREQLAAFGLSARPSSRSAS